MASNFFVLNFATAALGFVLSIVVIYLIYEFGDTDNGKLPFFIFISAFFLIWIVFSLVCIFS